MKILRKMTSAVTIAISCTSAYASESTDAQFQRLLSKYNVRPAKEQTYCYTDDQGRAHGTNVDAKVRLASVTKLLTSLWAVKELGINYAYDTKLYVKDGHMHIAGSRDPFMSNEKMIYLVSSLNKLGINQLTKITYDDNIQINPNAQFHAERYPDINSSTNGRWLKLYFNTNTWTPSLRADYVKYSNLAATGRYVKDPTFSVESVEYSATNPLVENLEELPEDVRVLTLPSPKLHKYLKEINVKSNNYASQTLFKNLGDDKAFQKFLENNYGLTNDDIRIHNGSGLPTVIKGTRYDNFATCRIVTELVANLKEEAENQGMTLEDVVAVPGSDAGTFRNRLNSADLKNTFVAKTGTLMHTSSLAGALNTKSGYSFFGVFNHTTDIASAKAVQNDMVAALFKELGGSKNFMYQVEGFWPYDKNSQVKKFNLIEEDTGFSEIDGDLIELN